MDLTTSGMEFSSKDPTLALLPDIFTTPSIGHLVYQVVMS